ncbi:hypothetical protein ScPMuIL_011598 [Solemya velum]
MLRVMFWTGLRQRLKDISGHKFDTIEDFDSLRVAIRQIEHSLLERTDEAYQHLVGSCSCKDGSFRKLRYLEIKGMIQKLSTDVIELQKQVDPSKKYQSEHGSQQQRIDGRIEIREIEEICNPIIMMKLIESPIHMIAADNKVCYGTTETSPVTYQSFMDDDIKKRVSTIGQPLDHVEAKVVDENGDIVAVGTPGELCTRGFTTMLEYWQDPVKTAEVIKKDRWYYTGDIGVMDEDGFCRIDGRIRDMLIRGGENIYPLEIEQVLYKHPKIKDVQVVGVPDERLGEEICAWIQLKEDVDASEQEIKDFCRGKIARYKVPRYIHFSDSYPMTVTGKVQKFKIREAAMKMLGLEHARPHYQKS